ncbi:hypothetical protein OGAPHI_006441 [Ogataea philodendri]|uniref:Uncharacterized protein n=1 Tax=Ogataea philodendri TaxID=1378263 RepID=A0A9P8T0B2_9ASCO|nr:uncharacterized protein OGAPHI_006441 [Ogataea philodendri]KAH3661593.1 hypothetical protein OGAPHI_006441 [Ogataea philodendri]
MLLLYEFCQKHESERSCLIVLQDWHELEPVLHHFVGIRDIRTERVQNLGNGGNGVFSSGEVFFSFRIWDVAHCQHRWQGSNTEIFELASSELGARTNGIRGCLSYACLWRRERLANRVHEEFLKLERQRSSIFNQVRN